MNPVTMFGVLAFVTVIVILILSYKLSEPIETEKKIGSKKIAEDIAKAWKKVDKVGELLELYFTMALKHGPDSQEAVAYRYGAEKESLIDRDEIKAFNTVVNRFNSACKSVNYRSKETEND